MGRRRATPLILALALGALAAGEGRAHPVPRQAHDRTVTVRLLPGAVVVDYRLEMDPLTVYEDLGEFSRDVDLPSLTRPEQFCRAFNRCYAAILADNLVARLDRKELAFQCVKTGFATRGEDGQLLDHLRCEFRFEAPWRLTPGARHELTFREGNYYLEAGRVRLALAPEMPVRILRRTEPSEALKALPETELKPGDNEKLRRAAATFTLGEPVAPAAPPPSSAGRPSPEPAATSPAADPPRGASFPGLTTTLAAASVVLLAGLLFLRRQLRRHG